VWDDIVTYRAQGAEYLGFPTQKPQELLARTVALSSNPGDLILDWFIGSGTTAAVAQGLGRRWIGGDINKGAIQTTSKRLQGIVREQFESGRAPRQGELEGVSAIHNGDAVLDPAQLSFAVYRVTEYHGLRVGPGPRTVAVKIVDMLGEEASVAHRIE
jgi:hypothetical protein